MSGGGSLLHPLLTRVKNPVPIGGAQVLARDLQAIAVPLLEDQGIAISVDERGLDGRAGRRLLLLA